MTELFKELNIIDILGIGVPGCLLVLLLGGDQTAALLWADQFQGNVLAFAVLLLVAGSPGWIPRSTRLILLTERT